MAVLDFRNGGYDRAHPSQGRDFGYSQQADYGYDDAQAAPAGDGLAARAARFLNYFGAMISVGLILFLMIWGYQLIMRDVSGVPVIRALEGAARTTPDDPGGEAARYTGYGVNAVPGGTEGAVSDQVAIAPDATGLDESDVAMGELGATVQPSVIEPELAGEAAPAILPEAAEMPVNEAVTEVAASEAAAVPETSQEEAIVNAMQEAMQSQPEVAHAVARSSRPAPRPRNLRVTAAAAPAAAQAAPAPAPTPAPVASTPVASGTVLAQIGALDSKADAERHWAKVSGKFGSLFSGKQQVIQTAETGGRTFVRLRVGGFADMAEARRFCAALIAEGTDCIPTSVK